ncbi:hypothetical protein VNO78_00113 [Psophocarpus tetragonolobus]|uniref:Uncharacterized protein n=1 Tax=Psophocarpus tetragonolobus TaxID=3891 RepID=A0AAN9SXP4_PSOTE
MQTSTVPLPPSVARRMKHRVTSHDADTVRVLLRRESCPVSSTAPPPSSIAPSRHTQSTLLFLFSFKMGVIHIPILRICELGICNSSSLPSPCQCASIIQFSN